MSRRFEPQGRVVALYVASPGSPGSPAPEVIVAEVDGIVGDSHRGIERRCYAGDKQAEGSRRRNERQWSAMSVEELDVISSALDLVEPLTAAELGVNLCIEGIAELSRLPKGSLLRFPSGAELLVVEYNPPCRTMGEKVAASHKTRTGRALRATDFSKAAKLTRGVVGVVDVPGEIRVGDTAELLVYTPPGWLQRTAR